MTNLQLASWISNTILRSVGPFGFAAFLPALLWNLVPYLATDKFDPEAPIFDQQTLDDEYDFIIVGGGSAGSVLTSRLSEFPEWKILLLEAGGDENPLSDVPTLATNLQMSTLDWQYTVEPSGTSCLGMNEGRCRWPRGRVLGGSSVLNYMLYIRGNRNDYDTWEQLGNPGWGYDDMLQYFVKAEDNRNPYISNSQYHGTGGPLTVQESPYKTPLVTAFIEAGEQISYENRDVNGAQQAGFMIAQGTIRRGERCSTNKAYLRPVKLRDNLHIALNSQVTKILIDEGLKRAYGVQFLRNGRGYEIHTRKEVILSTGTVNSPQILMLSGIGPHEELTRHGIPTVVDSPGVGRNLQDHVSGAGLTFRINQPISLLLDRFDQNGLIQQYLNGKGPLTTIAATEGVAFVATKYGNYSWPDVQYHLTASSINSQLWKGILNLRDDIYDAVYQPIENQDVYNLIPIVSRPESRGWIELRSSNPLDKPLVHANYFDHPIDMARVIEGFKIAIQLSQTKPFQDLGSRLHDTPLPPCRHLPFGSDRYWECHIRTLTMTIYHPVGTCKMGPSHDPMAVVDPRLRVYGTMGLRVIDGSIFPTITTGNTNAPIIAVAEKASDMIKEDWSGINEYTYEHNVQFYKLY